MRSVTTNLQIKALAVLAMLFLALAPRAAAQAISGDLVGIVTDATGAAVPNAAVEAVNTETNVRSTTTTNGSGEYRISNLPPGTYDISAKLQGFNTATLRGLRVALNQTATANLRLDVAKAQAEVTVTEAAAVIDTTTAQVQNTFETKQASDLPNSSIGQGVLNLSLLNAGVASSGGVGVGTGPSVGGQRPRNNNFTIEGVDNNAKDVTGPQVFIPNDAVAEFTLLQNQFSPEYGHSSGGQFNTIVRTGTNAVHGRIYEYNQNRNYNALDQAFARTGILSNPRYDQNRLGAMVGGPIIKDKWFYYANFEYNPLGRSSTPAGQIFTPTDAGYAALAGIPGVSETNLGILKQYVPAAATPDHNIDVGGVSIPVGILPFASPNFQNGYYGVASMDYNISDRDQLRGRFIYNRYSFVDTAANLPTFFVTLPSTFYLTTLAYYHTFSPVLTNEFRLGYNRGNKLYTVGDFSFPGLNAFPNLTIEELGGLNIGPDPNAPQGGITNLYQLADNITWTKGHHTLKFGEDFRKSIAPQFFTQRSRGDYYWTTLQGYVMDLAPDEFGERSAGNPTYYGDQISTYSYVNDQWRIRPNLTLNLGLRYEYFTTPYTMRQQTLNSVATVPGVLEFNEPKTQKNNWAPRVGFAYSPGGSGNTSIRGGFGIAYDVLFDNLGLLSLPPQLSTTQDVGDAGQPQGGDPNFLKNGGLTGGAVGSGVTPEDWRALTANYIQNTLKTPYSIQWNLGIQHVFRQNYTFEARYLGTRGVHLYFQTRPNVMPRVDAQHFLPTYMSTPDAGTLAALPYTLADLNARSNILPAWEAAGFSNPITSFTPQGYSNYNGLALQLTRRFSSGLQFIGAYTWSHLIDNSTAEVFSTVLTPRRPQDFQDTRNDRSNSALDRRHRFTFSMIYDAPFFSSSSNWFAKNLIGNWEIAPIYTYESPEYITIQSGIDSNLNNDSAGDRVIVNASGTPHTGSDVIAIDRTGATVDLGSDETVAYVARNPNAQYIRAGYGALANAGRNTEPLRPINNIDLTLLKRFRMTERWNVELGGQAFNLFNHPQYIGGSINDVAAVGQTSGSVTNMVRLTQTNLNTGVWNAPDQVLGSNPRSLQLFLKLNF